MRIEFDGEQKSHSTGDSDCADPYCKWNINGICTCEGIMPCLDYEFV